MPFASHPKMFINFFCKISDITKKNEDRFSRTANYHRHGGPGRKEILSERPMDLNEAEHFIRTLMLYWVI
jgi:hypothetical protein